MQTQIKTKNRAITPKDSIAQSNAATHHNSRLYEVKITLYKITLCLCAYFVCVGLYLGRKWQDTAASMTQIDNGYNGTFLKESETVFFRLNSGDESKPTHPKPSPKPMPKLKRIHIVLNNDDEKL